MKISTVNYNNPKQGYLPLFLSDCLDLLDPVLTFDRLMGVIDLNKYLTDIPEYTTGRLRYNPFNMLKTVLFGFMTSGYCSLREPEDNCEVISDSCISWITILHHTEPLDISSTKYFRIRSKTFLTTSIKQSSTRSMWICNISIDGSKFEAKRQQIYIAVVGVNHIVQIWTVSFFDEALQNKRMVSQLHCTEIPLTVLLAGTHRDNSTMQTAF